MPRIMVQDQDGQNINFNFKLKCVVKFSFRKFSHVQTHEISIVSDTVKNKEINCKRHTEEKLHTPVLQ